MEPVGIQPSAVDRRLGIRLDADKAHLRTDPLSLTGLKRLAARRELIPVQTIGKTANMRVAR